MLWSPPACRVPLAKPSVRFRPIADTRQLAWVDLQNAISDNMSKVAVIKKARQNHSRRALLCSRAKCASTLLGLLQLLPLHHVGEGGRAGRRVAGRGTRLA